MRKLVELGADVDVRLRPTEARPPHTASRLGVEGATAFLMAADRADAPLMRLLLELGADPFLPNADGSTPLMAAAGLGTSAPEEEAGSEAEARDAVQMLLDLGAEIDAVNAEGDTAMHGAAYGSFPTVVQLLADHGADIEVWTQPNDQGRTPLFIAEGYRGGLPRPSRPDHRGDHRADGRRRRADRRSAAGADRHVLAAGSRAGTSEAGEAGEAGDFGAVRQGEAAGALRSRGHS